MSVWVNTVNFLKHTMTRTKQILILPILSALVSVLAFTGQNASALVSTVDDKIFCTASAIGGKHGTRIPSLKSPSNLLLVKLVTFLSLCLYSPYSYPIF